MKCINCGTDNHLPERIANIGKCTNCQHQFVFEPAELPCAEQLTDNIFAELLEEVSAKKTMFFTPRQLYYLLNQKLPFRTDQVSLKKDLIQYLGLGTLGILAISFFFASSFQLPFEIVTSVLWSLYAPILVWLLGQSSISIRLNRRDRQQRLAELRIFAGLLFLIGLPASIVAQALWGMASAIASGLMAMWLMVERQEQQRNITDGFLIDRHQFEEWLSKWTTVNGQPVKILSQLPTEQSPVVNPAALRTEQFDRVVVCNRKSVAQLLISNNFPLENSCAVLTIDGYPEDIFAPTMEMLRRHPDLKVYALHDGSATGVQLVHRLRQEDKWTDINIPIIEVGIMPRQVMNNLELSICRSAKAAQAAKNLPAAVRASLNREELEWLDGGCYLDLESFSSLKIIQILQRAIQESRELTGLKGDEMADIDPTVATADFYLLENFG
jgi:hypothetical protein